ncbi:hypothetical protein CJ030_MR1G012661 [Morella rubra]|uniref:Uncharacterized protein n=1 Tax=Morella rubra TaxID=262757 RepID=A0A6A1WVZ5_9ROSI|nr:hypothetical protein CJ030_MR1G012661 [Morella rubra]
MAQLKKKYTVWIQHYLIIHVLNFSASAVAVAVMPPTATAIAFGGVPKTPTALDTGYTSDQCLTVPVIPMWWQLTG